MGGNWFCKKVIASLGRKSFPLSVILSFLACLYPFLSVFLCLSAWLHKYVCLYSCLSACEYFILCMFACLLSFSVCLHVLISACLCLCVSLSVTLCIAFHLFLPSTSLYVSLNLICLVIPHLSPSLFISLSASLSCIRWTESTKDCKLLPPTVQHGNPITDRA